MSRTAAKVTQADVARILRAVDQVGHGRWRVRVSRQGEIIVEPCDGKQAHILIEGEPTVAPPRLLREPKL